MYKHLLCLAIVGWTQLVDAQVTNPCAGLNSGFVAHANCTHYYSCVNQVAHERQCPAVYPIFEPNTQHCVAGNPDECVNCPATGVSRLPVPNSCTRFVLCFNGVGTHHECQPGLYFDPTLQQCNLAANVNCSSVQCPAVDDPQNPKFERHPSNCNQYFICVGGTAMLQTCPPGTAFNPAVNMCDLQSAVQCPSMLHSKGSSLSSVLQPLSTASKRCVGKQGIVSIPDPDNCSRYFVCLSGTEYSVPCSPGYIFDTKTSKCNEPELSICARDVTNICTGNVGMNFKPHSSNCTMYYMCMNEDSYELACSTGQHFDAISKTCLPIAQATCFTDSVETESPCAGTTGTTSVGDPSDCTRFFFCVNGVHFPGTCGAGFIFDVLTAQCNLPENSICIKDLATPPVVTSPGPATTIPTIPTSELTTPTPATLPTAPTEGPTPAPEASTPAPTPAPPAPTPAPPATTPDPSNPSAPYCPPGQVFYYPHPDCRRFYRCVSGTLFVLDCPPNQYWNQAREYCDHMWNVSCPSAQ